MVDSEKLAGGEFRAYDMFAHIYGYAIGMDGGMGAIASIPPISQVRSR